MQLFFITCHMRQACKNWITLLFGKWSKMTRKIILEVVCYRAGCKSCGIEILENLDAYLTIFV